MKSLFSIVVALFSVLSSSVEVEAHSFFRGRLAAKKNLNMGCARFHPTKTAACSTCTTTDTCTCVVGDCSGEMKEATGGECGDHTKTGEFTYCAACAAHKHLVSY